MGLTDHIKDVAHYLFGWERDAEVGSRDSVGVNRHFSDPLYDAPPKPWVPLSSVEFDLLYAHFTSRYKGEEAETLVSALREDEAALFYKKYVGPRLAPGTEWSEVFWWV